MWDYKKKKKNNTNVNFDEFVQETSFELANHFGYLGGEDHFAHHVETAFQKKLNLKSIPVSIY